MSIFYSNTFINESNTGERYSSDDIVYCCSRCFCETVKHFSHISETKVDWTQSPPTKPFFRSVLALSFSFISLICVHAKMQKNQLLELSQPHVMKGEVLNRITKHPVDPNVYSAIEGAYKSPWPCKKAAFYFYQRIFQDVLDMKFIYLKMSYHSDMLKLEAQILYSSCCMVYWKKRDCHWSLWIQICSTKKCNKQLLYIL